MPAGTALFSGAGGEDEELSIIDCPLSENVHLGIARVVATSHPEDRGLCGWALMNAVSEDFMNSLLAPQPGYFIDYTAGWVLLYSHCVPM